MTEHFLLVSTYIHDKDAIHTKCIGILHASLSSYKGILTLVKKIF